MPAKATKELPRELLALIKQKKMPKTFAESSCGFSRRKPSSRSGSRTPPAAFQLLKTYPICRWSGDIGPKEREGDRQTPEGFYTITPELMNPNSSYYLAINTGFPNAFDKANGRDGSFLMIHGDCSSSGCYAMTDEQVGEIYSLARDCVRRRPTSFQIQAYPFRMTPANLARHRTSPHLAFWKMIKIGNDHFETTHLEPKVDVCNRRYVFDAHARCRIRRLLSCSIPPSMPRLRRESESRPGGAEKQRADEAEYRGWSKRTCRSRRSTPGWMAG